MKIQQIFQPTDVMGSSPELRAGPTTLADRFYALRGLLVPQVWEVNFCDMSVYQGTVNYDLNASLSDATIARYSMGSSGVDNSAENHIAGAASHGYPHGGYHYCKPATDAHRNAQNFAARWQALGGALGPWADVEETGGLDKNHMLGWLTHFFNEFEQLTGVELGCYTSAGFLNAAMPLTNWLKNRKLWVANWTTAPQPTLPNEWRIPGKPWHFWQWKVYRPGSDYGVQSAGIDLDRYHGTRAQFDFEYGVIVEPPPPPEPEPGPLQFRVLQAGLNVRSGPGVTYPVVDVLAAGEIVPCLNADGAESWAEIALGQWANIRMGTDRNMEKV